MSDPRDNRLPRSYYLSPNVQALARSLIGKRLLTTINGCTTGGIITETEAYAGATDRASHAFGGRRTARTEIMYCQGGTAYVYLCYGIHALFNVVTNVEGIPHAILIRSIEPDIGIDTIKRRRKAGKASKLASGPGNVTKALAIKTSHTGLDLTLGAKIWIEDTDMQISPRMITRTPRIGIDYAGPDALNPWRYTLNSTT